jgi:hypothetical protein
MNKYTSAEFVDTYEAYSQITFFGNNNIAIPYINIGLMPNNPITHKQSFVDFSYYILAGVKSMEFGSAKGKLFFSFNLLVEDMPLVTEHITIGNYESVGAGVKVECRDMFYYTFDNSRISIRPDDFIPYETPNFKRTLDTEEIERFFSFQNIPDEIKAVLGDNISSMVWK